MGAYSMDAALVVAQVRPDAFRIAANELPPNLAATFRVVDGVLYAGGDPAQPQVGVVKVSYRAVAPGKTILTGVQHGDRLASE
jgi:Flp pilus assembly protein TadB